MKSRFGWPRLMRLGLGVLRLPPEAFWAMTPRELDAALAGLAGRIDDTIPMGTGALQRLMARYPDRS